MYYCTGLQFSTAAQILYDATSHHLPPQRQTAVHVLILMPLLNYQSSRKKNVSKSFCKDRNFKTNTGFSLKAATVFLDIT